MIPLAEVIGDPVGHSLSPAIHRYWLERLEMTGSYEASKVAAPELPAFLAMRRARTEWRGCSVTAPHKEAMLALVDGADEAAAAVGAVNCVSRRGDELVGTNTDVDGIAEALAEVRVGGQKVVLIGGGGAARAAVYYFRQQGAGEIVLLLRRPAAAGALGPGLRAYGLEEAAQALSSAALIVNATPLGLAGGEAMPRPVLDAVREAGTAAAFDMVYRPVQTDFLGAAAEGGALCVDGLAMLVGQARRAFALFFGSAPPLDEGAELRSRLVSAHLR